MQAGKLRAKDALARGAAHTSNHVSAASGWGASMPLKPDSGKAPAKAFAPGTILSARTGAAVSFDELIADVRTARVAYVGEMHTSARHHEIQLKVIRALHEGGIRLAVAEMFDRSYQMILDRWTAGDLDEKPFCAAPLVRSWRLTIGWRSIWTHPH
jgi:uncharacterized iron-regulated protein